MLVNRYSSMKFPPYKKRDWPKMLYRSTVATVTIEAADEKGIVKAQRLERPIIQHATAENLDKYREMLADGWVDGYKRVLIEARKLPNPSGDVIRVVSADQLIEQTPEEEELRPETDEELNVDPTKEMLVAEPEAIEITKAERKKAGRPKGKSAIRADKQTAA